MIRVAVLALLLAGCSFMPEVPEGPTTALAGVELPDYPVGPVEPMPRVSVPEPLAGKDGAPYWRLDYKTMAQIEAALAVGDENTAALVERNEQIRLINAERKALLYAGQMAESQAQIYYELYANEIQQGWLDVLLCRGVTGAALILLAGGSL